MPSTMTSTPTSATDLTGDTQAELTARFLGESPVAESAHVALGLAVTALLIGIYPSVPLITWFALLVLASLLRFRIRKSYASRDPVPRRVPGPVYVTIALVGLV